MATGNPGYSPLPQSNSDSDGSEEEEIHISQENKLSNRTVDVKVLKSAKTFAELNKNVINYKPLDDDRQVEESFGKFQSSFSINEVFIQKSSNPEKFSVCRKICFVFSLFLCVFTTIAFMWILPCNIESCPVVEDMKNLIASDPKSDNYTWKKSLHNLEIIGPCSLVSDSFNRNQNLVFLAKNYLNSDEKYSENFLLSLKGEDGSLNWKVRFEKESAVVDCRLIDVDLDGLNDCLLFGKHFITTINSITGNKIWNIDNLKKGVEQIFLNFPIVLPDINNDEVKDLLLSYSLTNSNEKYIAVISGKTGKAISNSYEIAFCDRLYNLVPSNGTILSFTCSNLKKESYKIDLMDIFSNVRTSLRNNINFSNWNELLQYQKHSNTVFVNNLQLTLKNQGHCPESCRVFVSIKDESKESTNKSVYHYSNKNAFGMAPLTFNFMHMSGFILKFWEWNGETEKLYFENGVVYPVINFSKIEIGAKETPVKSKNLSTLTYLEQEMLREGRQSVKRDKRNSARFSRPENEANLRLITETLVKITRLSDTQLSISHILRDEIIQVCQKPHICHPDVHQQIHSTLIARFNGNEGERLVTFSSKNVLESKSNKPWQIHSQIQMLNCE